LSLFSRQLNRTESSAFGDPACWSAIDDPLGSGDMDTDSEEGTSDTSQDEECKKLKSWGLSCGNSVAGVRG